MKKYYYLSKLGIPKCEQMDNWVKEIMRNDDRKKEWKKNEKKYGINDIVTWCFDEYYMDFMYIHLKRYYEISKDTINLSFSHIKWEEEEYSIGEAIEYILNWLEKGYYGMIEEKFNDVDYVNTFVKERNKVLHLIAEIVPYINW